MEEGNPRRIYVHVEHLSHSTGYNPQSFTFQKDRAPFSSNENFFLLFSKGKSIDHFRTHWLFFIMNVRPTAVSRHYVLLFFTHHPTV